MKQIVFATNNNNKLREMREIMEGLYEVLSLDDIGCHEEIIEDADTIEGNAKIKADFVTDNYHVDCFADDTGLEVEALGGAPGVYSARYAGPQKNPTDNMAKLLAALDGNDNRRARFHTEVVLVLDGVVHHFEGFVDGIITTEKHGNGGFGYDPIFKPDGFDATMAEMSAEEKNRISHRGMALRKMAEWLAKNV